MLLTLSIFLPLIGMVVVLFLPKDNHNLIRWTSVGFATATFIPILMLTMGYMSEDGLASESLLGEREAVLKEAPAGSEAAIRSLTEPKDAQANYPEALEKMAEELKRLKGQCGATAIDLDSAIAAILRLSQMPPAWMRSGCTT